MATSDGVQSGEARALAFEPFYRERYEPMVRLAYLLVSSLHEAEELVQESFVVMHREWHRVEHPDAFLRRVVVNRCRSRLRRLELERRHAAAAGEPVIDLTADELSDALEGLPEQQRAAVVLRYYADLSQREIAEALDCRLGNVGSLISRGLAGLRRALP